MITKKPWGYYRVLYQEDQILIKVLVIDPGAELSLQRHEHRSETWFVEIGSGEAHISGKKYDIKEGDVLEVPVLAFHRIKNTGDGRLFIFEVQHGDSISEDDILRIEDKYGRA
jgi:mannose-6-phosphate isomerase-like protein (cupin superfamily)